MTDYCDWPNRLVHLRFSRLVLFLEKWASIFTILILAVAGVQFPLLSIAAVVIFITMVCAWNYHFNLEEAAGMPISRFTVRY